MGLNSSLDIGFQEPLWSYYCSWKSLCCSANTAKGNRKVQEMHRSRHTGVPTQAWKALRLGSEFPVGAVWTWLETCCCDVCGRAGPAAPRWEMKITFRCISHAYCATQRHKWWKSWSRWAVGSDAVAAFNLCSQTKGITQGKSWNKLIFRDRLEFN